MSLLLHQSRQRRVSPFYLALLERWPLRPIRTENEYGAAGAMLDSLVMRNDLDRGETDYLGALELLIEAYDEEHFPDLADDRPPHERLKALMESSGMKPAALERILGASQTLVSLMLSGKRELSKKTIATLSDYFRVEANYFL